MAIGRLLAAVPTRVGSPLSRLETVRSILQFWATHGADWMPFQEQLERYVERQARFRFDESVTRKILDALVEARILHRALVPPRTIQYRLDRQFADPTWPGFAREIDDLLVDPLPWLTADGRIFKVGVRQDESRWPFAFQLPTRPHYFATHAWTRAWIHAFNYGLFDADPAQALEVARRAAREAALFTIVQVYQSADEENAPGLRALVEASAFYRDYHALLSQPLFGPLPLSRTGKAGITLAEDALALLHVLCGHARFTPRSLPRGGGPFKHPPAAGPHRLVRERPIYEALDRCALVRTWFHGLRLPKDIQRDAGRAWKEALAAYRGPMFLRDLDTPDTVLAFHAPMGPLLPRIREAAPRVRRTMMNHALAWPIGGASVPW